MYEAERREVIGMEYEVTVRKSYRIQLAQTQLDAYFLDAPHVDDTSEWADRRRDDLMDAFNALVRIAMNRADVGDLQGVITFRICDPDWVAEDEIGLGQQAALALKDPTSMWVVNYEVETDEQMD
jgi:hypothetical protein